MSEENTITPDSNAGKPQVEKHADQHCPVCGAELTSEKCKVVCRSPQCVYRIIFNCAEF